MDWKPLSLMIVAMLFVGLGSWAITHSHPWIGYPADIVAIGALVASVASEERAKS